LYKWRIPSCIPCNHELGKIEEDLLRRVAFALDPNTPANQSIVDKALRSVNPAAARDERDRAARASLMQRMYKEMLDGTAIPRAEIYQGMGERWGRPIEEQTAIVIPTNSLPRITEKIVRGIFYIEDGVFIEPPFAVKVLDVNDVTSGLITQILDTFGQSYAREPGIVVRRAVTPEDGIGSLFEIEIWQQFKVYAAVTETPLGSAAEER
jgi:hypothetical protein